MTLRSRPEIIAGDPMPDTPPKPIGVAKPGAVFTRILSAAEWLRALSAPAPAREIAHVTQPHALGLPSGVGQLLAESIHEIGQALAAYHAEEAQNVWARAHHLSILSGALSTALATLEGESSDLPAVAALLRDLLGQVAPRKKYLSSVVQAYSIESGAIAEIPLHIPGHGAPELTEQDVLPEGITARELSAAIHPNHRGSGALPLLRELFSEWSRKASADGDTPPFWIWLETR